MPFSADWLALREPADHDALNPDVRRACRRFFASWSKIRVTDLGCGAGSNLRGLFAALPAEQHWTLVDYDPALLAAARARLMAWADWVDASGDVLRLAKEGRDITIAFRQADFSEGDFAPLLEGAELVTAAALFDLVSCPVIDRLAETVTGNGQAFLTVLTYDGHAAWTPGHLADDQMREAFNRHQRTDKGFGAAAGPDATEALAKAFYQRGYRVLRGTSPWKVDARYGSLRRDLDEGWAAAVAETGRVAHPTIDHWLKIRNEAADAVTIVGHEDLLALPD
jgi:SAM-dependent methyltransferase